MLGLYPIRSRGLAASSHSKEEADYPEEDAEGEKASPLLPVEAAPVDLIRAPLAPPAAP
jgi:hypothetical protein